MLSKPFKKRKSIRRKKIYFAQHKKIEYMVDSERHAPLGSRNSKDEIIQFPDESLLKKRSIINQFFPNRPKEITSNYKDEDIIRILKKYKKNLENSKLKNGLNYFKDFNPEDKQNISNWRIDKLLADNKETNNLISPIISIVKENKTSNKYKKDDILSLLVFALGINNLNKEIQTLFFEETNKIPEIVEYEKNKND